MTWARFDDGVLDSPEMLRAGEDAANLHLRAVIWCCKHLTDGAVPREALGAITRKRDPDALAARLVGAGVWAESGEGWRIKRFEETNPTRDEVEARRTDLSAKRAAAGRAGGLKSGIVRSNREAKPKQVASGLLEANEAPSRPVPSRPDPSPSALFARTGAGAREGESAAGEQEQTAETPVVTCSTVEPTRPLAYAADELVADLERVSRLRFSMPTVHLAELNKVLRDLSAQGRPITRAAIERVDAHLAAKHTAPGAGGRPWVPSTTSLRGTDGAWGRLVSLCDEAHACARCAAPPGADVIPLHPEALRPLLDAFLAGAGGAVPGVPREGMAAADAEKLLASAGATPELAHRMGEIAAGPSARWTSLRRFTEARRAPTVQELNACDGEGFSALHAAAARAAAPPPEPRRPVRVISDAEAMRAQPYTGPSREAVGAAMDTILARYPVGVRRPSFHECYQEALALAGKQS